MFYRNKFSPNGFCDSLVRILAVRFQLFACWQKKIEIPIWHHLLFKHNKTANNFKLFNFNSFYHFVFINNWENEDLHTECNYGANSIIKFWYVWKCGITNEFNQRHRKFTSAETQMKYNKPHTNMKDNIDPTANTKKVTKIL